MWFLSFDKYNFLLGLDSLCQTALKLANHLFWNFDGVLYHRVLEGGRRRGVGVQLLSQVLEIIVCEEILAFALWA